MKIWDKINKLLQKEVVHEPNTVYLTCDGSVTENPGGRCTVGAVLRIPNQKPITIQRFSPPSSNTNNHAEYDAIYLGLESLFGLSHIPYGKLIITSDSKLVVKQLHKEWQCNNEILLKKRDVILNALSSWPGIVCIVWKRRCSTPDLETANYLAQELNDVTPH